MLSISYLFEDKKPELGPGEYAVVKRKKKKVRDFNPRTNRMKKFKRNQYFVTKIAPEDRTVRNIPKDAKGFPIATFQQWLQIKGEKKYPDSTINTFGKAANGKWYGWSHRAIASFGIGDKITEKTSGFENLKKPFTIKTDARAREVALIFAKSVA